MSASSCLSAPESQPKGRYLALGSLERIRLRQRARLLHLKHSGTSSKFFHLKINSRRRKKAIPSLCQGGQWATTKEDKLALAHDYFLNIMGAPAPPSIALDFSSIGRDNWPPEGGAISHQAPNLFSFIRDGGKSMAEGLSGNAWVADIRGGLSIQAMVEYLGIWDLVAGTYLAQESSDKII
ncbi:hypothetical protein E2562_031020 [Oryza meyeriana var. granulata]|uniref:Uncharacterized protein n=1 Tax=Oryza meyeriana var. granulata TaxID=110450 RepID=A0A6G1ERD9_9ORYZ|nr:hypothetical protein E2562_031020 [Oryza meyeriana var. granulata]